MGVSIKYIAYDIQWDAEEADLPQQVEVLVPSNEQDVEEYIADYLTCATGFLQDGFKWAKESERRKMN